MKKHERSPCPVACTLDLIGDKWTLLIVRDLACGKSQFKDFAASPEQIASNILADRLAKLMKHRLVEKVPQQGTSARSNYRLTARGESLRPVLRSLVRWGAKNIEGTVVVMRPVHRDE